MTTFDFAPKLSPRFAVYLRDFLLDRDIDPQFVFLKCGIDQITESELALPIPTSKVSELFDVAARESGDPLLGFNMARQYHYESGAMIVLAMMAAPTVGDAIETLGDLDKYVDTGIKLTYDFSDDLTLFSAQLLGVDGTQTMHLNEFLITLGVNCFSSATRKPVPIREAHFQHPRAVGSVQISNFYRCTVKFGMPINAIRFDSFYLKEHQLTSNELLYETLTNALRTYFAADARQYGFIDSVCRELMRQTAIESANLQFVADSLAISARTLRRRIKEEGFTFQQVKNLARERQTKYLLANTNISLSEIADSLGYAELSSFSRAFKNWAGVSPQQYREHARKLMSA